MSQCTATAKSSGKRCSKTAMHGGTVCDRHGGLAPQVRSKAAVRAEVLSWRLGDAVDDPGEVLLRLVTQSRQRADLLAAEIEAKIADGREVWGDEFTLERILVGDTMAVGEYGEATKTGEYIRGLVKLEADERDRLASFAAKAIAAGLAERQVRIAERLGEQIAAVMLAVIGSKLLALSADQQKVFPDVIRAELTKLQSN